jgi:hypothetical protein
MRTYDKHTYHLPMTAQTALPALISGYGIDPEGLFND